MIFIAIVSFHPLKQMYVERKYQAYQKKLKELDVYLFEKSKVEKTNGIYEIVTSPAQKNTPDTKQFDPFVLAYAGSLTSEEAIGLLPNIDTLEQVFVHHNVSVKNKKRIQSILGNNVKVYFDYENRMYRQHAFSK